MPAEDVVAVPGDAEQFMLYGEGGEGGSEVTMFKVHLIQIQRNEQGAVEAVTCSTCGWAVATDSEMFAWSVWGAHVRLTRVLLGLVSPN